MEYTVTSASNDITSGLIDGGKKRKEKRGRCWKCMAGTSLYYSLAIIMSFGLDNDGMTE